MKEIRVTRYFEFGGSVEYLRQVTEVEPFFGDIYVQYYINRVAEYIEQLNMSVTSRSRSFDEMMDFYDEMEKKEESYLLTKEDCSRLSEIMQRLMEFIQAEISGKYAYILTEKRIDINKLFSNVELLMAPNVFDNLPDIVQYDFKEGGKCISLGRATAAAFHTLRGTEGTLRWFYGSITNSIIRDNWTNILKKLQKLQDPPPKEIIDQLYNINKNYRNPTAHPEKQYDVEEVQDLFNECVAVINRMVLYIL